jgi:tetratricopeptide (TPR) repeat protein
MHTLIKSPTILLGLLCSLIGTPAFSASPLPVKAHNQELQPLSKSESLRKLQEFAKNGSVAEGRLLIASLLKDFDQDADVHTVIGDFYRSIGASAKALDQYKQALALAPNNSRAFYGIAQIYLTSSDDAKALENASKAFTLSPNSKDIRLAYVSALIRNGNLREADKQLDILLADPKSAADADVNYVAYQLHSKRSQLIKAEQFLDRAMALNPKQYQWLSDKADILEAKGDYANEKKVLEKLITIDPYSMNAIKHLGLLMEFYLHDYGAAIEQYQKLLSFDPDYSEALTGIDRCRAKRNDIAGQLKIELWRSFDALTGQADRVKTRLGP